jgi:cell division protein FtsL
MRKPKRKISLFNFLIFIFTAAAVIILFVNNIIRVNSLSVENNKLREEYNSSVSVNNTLKTEIERLTTFDKIKPVAVDKLNMNYSNNKTKTIIINASDLEIK